MHRCGRHGTPASSCAAPKQHAAAPRLITRRRGASCAAPTQHAAAPRLTRRRGGSRARRIEAAAARRRAVPRDARARRVRGPRRRARPDGPRLQGRLPAQGQGVAPRPAPQRPDGHEKVPGALRGLRRDQGLGRARGLRRARALPGHGPRLRPAAPAERGAGGGDVGRGLGRLQQRAGVSATRSTSSSGGPGSS